jgi:HK97 gp10 family phage protein
MDLSIKFNAHLDKKLTMLEKLQGITRDESLLKITKEIAARVQTKVKKNSPVFNNKSYSESLKISNNKRTKKGLERILIHHGGQLRRSWISKPLNSSDYILQNNTFYAPYVEYGHRQRVGQFVPYIGKRLKKPWIEGQHFLQNAVDEIRPLAVNIARNNLNMQLRKALK